MKYFRMSWHEILFERSFLNLILLNRAIPGVKPFKNKEEDGEEESEELDDKTKLKRTNDFFMGLM